MPAPGQNYAAMMNMVRKHRDGSRPLTTASDAVRKKVISETPDDPGERPAKMKTPADYNPAGKTESK